MYPIADALKERFESGERKKAWITLSNASVDGLVITEEDIKADSFSIDRYCATGNKVEIGSAVSSEFSVVLNNSDGKFDSIVFEGSVLCVDVGFAHTTGNYVRCGFFTVDEPPRTFSTISLKALDYMMLYDKTVDRTEFTEAFYTPETLVKKISKLCGVDVSSEINFDALPNSDESLSIPTTATTYRQLLQWVAEITATCAYIDWDGKLRMSWFVDTPVNITPALRYTGDVHENDIKITGVTVKTQDATATSGGDKYPLLIEGNGFVYSQTEQNRADNIGAVVNGFTYRPYECTCLPMPYLFPLDRITYTDKSGKEISTVVTNHRFGLNSTSILAAQGETQQKKNYASQHGLTKAEVDSAIAEAMKNFDSSAGHFYVKYSAYEKGRDDDGNVSMFDKVQGDTAYLGTCATDSKTPPESPDDYNWVRIRPENGKPGRSVVSVKTQYYLSTSSTEQTGGSWSDTMPDWVENTYLWKREVVTYENPTETVNGTAILDTSWDVLGDIKEDASDAKKKASAVELATDEFNKSLLNALGFHVTDKTVAGTTTRYYHSKSNLVDCVAGDIILIFNSGGFGVCTTGWNDGNPDFTNGADFKGGKFIWNILVANKINADNIEAGVIKSLDNAPVKTELSLNTGLMSMISTANKQGFAFGTNDSNDLLLQYNYSDSDKLGVKTGYYKNGSFYADSGYKELIPPSSDYYYGDVDSGKFYECTQDEESFNYSELTDLSEIAKTYKGFIMHSSGATFGYEAHKEEPNWFGDFVTSDFSIPTGLKGNVFGVYKGEETEDQPERTPILRYYDYEAELSDSNPHFTEIRKQSIGTKYFGAEKIAFNYEKCAVDLETMMKGIVEAVSDQQEQIDDLSKGNIGGSQVATPQMYREESDADDTPSFQRALENNRLVYVPEGTYKLSGTLIVRQNCELKLSQATHLKFEQTEGNCIELRSSATLRGDHAVIEVPYAFVGNVICVDTIYDEKTTDTPPFAHYDPMWKRARYIYDVCIVKPNSAGLHCSIDGECSGTGIYLSAKGYHKGAKIPFIWGAMLQGIRIAGGFTYGINVHNEDDPDNPNDPNDDPDDPYDDGLYDDDAWNHDMRIEAVIQGCETSVSLFNCNLAHLAVTIQPSTADGSAEYRYTKYAKWGVRLEDCKGIDMTSSFVWDWQAARDDSEEFTHIAMYGNCTGLVLGDYLYHANASTDIRKQIYSDRPSNLEKMTVLQEPITRWFKPIGNAPYFSTGKEDKELLLKEDFDICFKVGGVANFTDELARATDLNGNIYNGIGYEVGVGYIASNGVDMDSEYYARTGFIKCKTGATVSVEGIKITPDDGWSGALLYTSNKGLRDGGWISSYNLLNNSKYYYTDSYTETENGFSFRIVATDVEYVRFTTKKGYFGSEPVVAVNEEISYSQAGFLADSIKVNAKNVIGLPSKSGVTLESPDGTLYKIVVNNDGTLSTTAM